MILLIDAGNTRIKWALIEGARWLDEGALAHDEVSQLAELPATRGPVDRVFGSNVAGPRIAADITDALRGTGQVPQWLRSSAACCGVTNGYDTPAQLGTDRWAALIGARTQHPFACLVINAGTATTIDLLDADGHFSGGVILPGERLMRRALAGNTAQLPFADGRYTTTPHNTADAIATGCLHAQAGAVERMFRQIADAPQATCLISGGGAGSLAPLLALPLRHVDNLVLKGLAAITLATQTS